MADVAAVYTLTTPGPDITFNSGSPSYEIQEIQGLGSAPVRAPIDDVPFGDGGIVHTFWKGPRHVIVDGVFLVDPTGFSDETCRAMRADMEEDLKDALESIIAANGTFAWTPEGQSACSLTVRNDVALECHHSDNYGLLRFSFGLVAANPDFN